MDDDFERRIADLEGRSAADGVARQPSEPTVNEQNPFEDPETLRRVIVRWLREHWTAVAIGVISILLVLLTKLEKVFPAMRQPAPEWVGLVALAIPFTAVAIYFIVRFFKSQR